MPKIPHFSEVRGQPRWPSLAAVQATSYRCGYCGDKVSSDVGIPYHLIGHGDTRSPGILICPSCNGPTFVYPSSGEFFPGASVGSAVRHIPTELGELYDEARGCVTVNHFTAAVLLCRKMLMHLAVAQGAKEGLAFIEYVDFLVKSGYVPPNGKHWVDHIRKKGNEANHEIVLMKQEDAKDLITFIEMLLRFIYEFPNSIPKEPAKGKA